MAEVFTRRQLIAGIGGALLGSRLGDTPPVRAGVDVIARPESPHLELGPQVPMPPLPENSIFTSPVFGTTLPPAVMSPQGAVALRARLNVGQGPTQFGYWLLPPDSLKWNFIQDRVDNTRQLDGVCVSNGAVYTIASSRVRNGRDVREISILSPEGTPQQLVTLRPPDGKSFSAAVTCFTDSDGLFIVHELVATNGVTTVQIERITPKGEQQSTLTTLRLPNNIHPFLSDKLHYDLFDTGAFAVIRSSDQMIHTIDKKTGAVLSFPQFTFINQMTQDPNGNLYMIEDRNIAHPRQSLRVVKLSIDNNGVPRMQSAITVDSIMSLLPDTLRQQTDKIDIGNFRIHEPIHVDNGLAIPIHVQHHDQEGVAHTTHGLLFLETDNQHVATGSGSFLHIATDLAILDYIVITPKGIYKTSGKAMGHVIFTNPDGWRGAAIRPKDSLAYLPVALNH